MSSVLLWKVKIALQMNSNGDSLMTGGGVNVPEHYISSNKFTIMKRKCKNRPTHK